MQERTNDSGTTQSFRITAATWAPGIYTDLEGALLDIYDDDGDPKRNAAGDVELIGVDFDERVITVTGTEAELDTVAAGDIIMPFEWYGATIDADLENCFPGLVKVLSHESGVLSAVDADDFSKWRGNVTDIAGKATWSKLLGAYRKCRGRGIREDMLVWTSEASWQDIMNELSAAKVFRDETRSEMRIGTNNIAFDVGGVTLTIESHPFVMRGEILGFAPKHYARIGTHDPKMEDDGEMLMEGKKARLYRESWGQVLLPKRGPSYGFYVTGVVPESVA